MKKKITGKFITSIYIYIYLFFEREFQLMVFVPNDSSISSDLDTNQFLV